VLRRLNEGLRQRIEIQATHIAKLTEERDTLKAHSETLLRKWGKMKEEDIGVQTPMSTPTPARSSSSQYSPVIVKLGEPSDALQRTESPSLSRISKTSYTKGTNPEGKGVRDTLAVRISWKLPKAAAVDVELQQELGENLSQSSSVREHTRDSTSHKLIPTGPSNKASSKTNTTVRPILRSRYEAPYDADCETENDIATHVGTPDPRTSRRTANELRSPLDWKPDDVESGTYGGIHDRGQGQGPSTEDLDAPSRWRMDLWNAPFAAKSTGGRVTEKLKEM